MKTQIYDQELSQPGIFCKPRKRKHKKTTYLVNDSPRSNPLTSKTTFNKFQTQKK